MFVFSLKTSKKQLLFGAVCIVAVLCLLCIPPLADAVKSNGSALPIATTAEQGAQYLQSLGYEVSGGDEREVQLPDTADETLTAYNELLKQAGLDITPLLGKRIKFRTYTVKNHPSGNATAHLYIYKDRIVAGDITVNGVPEILKPKDITNGTTG